MTFAEFIGKLWSYESTERVGASTSEDSVHDRVQNPRVKIQTSE